MEVTNDAGFSIVEENAIVDHLAEIFHEALSLDIDVAMEKAANALLGKMVELRPCFWEAADTYVLEMGGAFEYKIKRGELPDRAHYLIRHI